MATFITSRTVGRTINITVNTSTGYWKYNHDGTDSSVFLDVKQTNTEAITVANANGEFTIIPCLSDGTVSGSLTVLYSISNQLTSFDGTGLSGLTNLRLMGNQLTSFDGTGLTSLTTLNLNDNQITSFNGTDLSSLTSFSLRINQLTSFDGTGLSSLNGLDLSNNLLTTFDGTDLSSLIELGLTNNQLTSLDITSLSSLTTLYLTNNQLTSLDITSLSSLNDLDLENNPILPRSWDSILSTLVGFGNSEGILNVGDTQRTESSDGDYDILSEDRMWNIGGTFEIVTLPTFITAQLKDETISINVQTSTGYWKYNHNETDSSVFSDGLQTATVANANGEFTLIPCLSDGPTSGDITYLILSNNPLTSFDGTDLSSLTELYLYNNQLTSFSGTGLSSLTGLHLGGVQLTSFDGTGLSSLTSLVLRINQLTSFDGTGLSGLTTLDLGNNQLTTFDGTGLSSLTELYIGNNPIPALVNNQILADLVGNNVSNGYLGIDGSPNLVRTTASNSNYDYLTNTLIWNVNGTYSFPSSGLGKIRVKGVNSGSVPIPQWDGGTIYNIGDVVTNDGQTWNCIQYAPAGYGPFGGYIGVYWTL